MTIINNSLTYSADTLVYNNECELLWQTDYRVSAEIYNNGIDHLIVHPGGDSNKLREISAPITGYNYVTTKFKIWCNGIASDTGRIIEYSIHANDDNDWYPYWDWHVSTEPFEVDPMRTNGRLCYRYAGYNMPYFQFTATGGSAYTHGQASIWYDSGYHYLASSTSAKPHYYRLIMSNANSVASAYLDNKYIGSGSLPPGRTALSAYTLHGISNHTYTVGIHSFKVGGFSEYEDALNWE